jgi:hypothetical protein
MSHWFTILLLWAGFASSRLLAADWPQLMHGLEHAGDAAAKK